MASNTTNESISASKPHPKSSRNRIVELSDIISSKTKELDAYFTTHGIKSPSFAPDAPTDISLPNDLALSRDLLLDATTELNELILGPRGVIDDFPYHYLISLHFLLTYNIHRLFPISSSTTYSQIATAIGLPEALVRRLLRHAIVHRCFREISPGTIAHTAMSRLFAEDPYLADFTIVGAEEMMRTTTYVVPALREYRGDEEPGHAAFGMANAQGGKDGRTCYEIIGSDPVRARRFMKCMSMNLMGPGFGLEHIAGDTCWDRVPANARIVDVGGSHGDVAVALARRHMGFEIVVQDLEKTVEEARMRELPEEVKGRVRFEVQDFFEEQRVKGADVYFLRWIFHNWAEEYCVRILRALVPALKTGARVVVNEWCLPEVGTVRNRVDRKMRAMDVSMLMLFNSQEREPKEWVALFQKASPRFVLEGVSKTEGANLSMLSFIYQ